MSRAISGCLVLIETLWNVKLTDYELQYSVNDVLIETLWNVKLVQRWAELKGMTVLIETLWNVKNICSFIILHL